MDLFHVERYYLDDDEEDSKCSAEKERQRLDSLNERIRKRKSELSKAAAARPSGESGNSVEINSQDEVKEESKPKRKKKKKRSEDGSKDNCKGHENSVENVVVTEEISPIKRRKKVKLKQSDCELQEEILQNKLHSKDLRKMEEDERGAELKELGKIENEVTDDNDDDDDDDDNSVKEDNILINNNKNNMVNVCNDMSNEHCEFTENTESQNGENLREQQKGDVEYFPILGSDKRKKEKQLVKRTLPKWISEPKLMAADITHGRVPVDDVKGLSGFLNSKLKENNIEYLFPVQAIVIPYLLDQQSKGTVYGKGGLIPSDVCVSAPTGSGKTLAYVLPIIQILSQCFVRRLQAIVILPSKDLAVQIKAVMSNYATGTHVRVGLAAGMKSFQNEQEQLVKSGSNGFVNNVDILVCTPGRLVDHIDNTAGFSLQHLRFLIIDEADRLLGQAYHNWLEKIFKAAYRSRNDQTTENNIATFRSRTQFLTPSSLDRVELPLQKLLFSATMTQNPEKLAPLQLFRPVLFTSAENVDNFGEAYVKNSLSEGNENDPSNERFILPESLTEKMTVCKQGEKPLVVIHLMKKLEYTRALCFTGSIETTHRLFLLVKSCGIRVAEFSSTLNQSQRKGILRDFKAGDIDLLICSDAMSRGIDIEKVQHVISYDPPVNIKTYVHRVGRTARAGQQGNALTILYPKEVFHFKKIIRNGKRTTLQKLNITQSEFEPLIGQYEEALESLKDSVETERSQGYKQRNKKK